MNVIIKLSSRRPTVRAEERDESKRGAIWERSVLRIPAASVTEQQMHCAGRALCQRTEGAGKAGSDSVFQLCIKMEPASRRSCQLSCLTATVQGKTLAHSCCRKAITTSGRRETNS